MDNLQNHNRESVLHEAARLSSPDLVRDLVEKYGATIDSTDSNDISPAFRAFSGNNHEVLDYFGWKGMFVDFEPEDKCTFRLSRAKSGLRSKREQVDYGLFRELRHG